MSEYDEVLKLIYALLDEDKNEEEIASILLSRAVIKEGDVFWAVEMAKAGAFRATFLAKGDHYPKSNIDDDPFLNAAIEYNIQRLRNTEDDTLKANLASEEPSLRSQAILELGLRKDRILQEILPSALRDQNKSIRSAAIRSTDKELLGSFSDVIIELYDAEQDIHISALIATLFQKCNWKPSIPALIKKLDHPEKILRLYAIEALGIMQAKEAKERLKTFLNDTEPLIAHNDEGQVVFYAGTSLATASQKALKSMRGFWSW